MFSAEGLWDLCYPGVDFEEASEEDSLMFFSHADSVNLYLNSKDV